MTRLPTVPAGSVVEAPRGPWLTDLGPRGADEPAGVDGRAAFPTDASSLAHRANLRESSESEAEGAHPPLAPFPGGTAKSVSANVRIGGVDVVDDAELAGRCPLESLAGLAFGHPATDIWTQSVFRAVHRDYGVPVAIRHPRPFDYLTHGSSKGLAAQPLKIGSSAPHSTLSNRRIRAAG
jgi:hypothetical protein